MYHRVLRSKLSCRRPRCSARSPALSMLRGFPRASVPSDPQGRSLRHCARARGIRQRDSARGRWRRDRIPVGHRLPPLSPQQIAALATTPVEELLNLPMLQPDQVTSPLHAYQLSKRGNSLRVMSEAVRWVSAALGSTRSVPGLSITPLANDELKGPRGAGYRRMIRCVCGWTSRHPRRGGNGGRTSYGT